MKNISVALATFNEEENISKCLSGVRDWVDEIVVVDGSSTDGTVELAKKFNAKIIVTDNPPLFHINKQKAIDLCAGKWILQLDADEVVTEELKKEILSIINPQPVSSAGRATTHNPQLTNGYWIPRKNFFLGKWLSKGGQYPDYSLRLYRKGKGRLPCKSVHEQAVVEGKVEYLKNPLLHYPYPDFSQYWDHYRRYTDIFAAELRQDNLQVNFGQTLNYLIVKPVWWFLKSYIRHKGFVDGFAGLVFSFFSSLRFPISYLKYCKNEKR